jgi:4-hydroxybenzoate polyprenyltransferase
MSVTPALVRLLRPKQWVKNTFVFAGIVFGAQLRNAEVMKAVVLTFIAFSLMSSSVYILNDFLDREADKRHPTKRNRPLASGVVTPLIGFSAAAVCSAVSLTAAALADIRVLGIIITYLAINGAYSLWLKHQVVIDVFCIASGFMLRIVAGTWGIGIRPTGWLILTGMFLALFLGFAKRRAEWTEVAGAHARRRVLEFYSRELLDSFLSIAATGTVLSYGLYTLDPATIALHHTDKLIYTLPFVLFGLFRYLFLLYNRSKGENPSTDVFTDYQMVLCGVAYGGCALWILNH